MANGIELSIVVSTYNQIKFIAACLQSMLEALPPIACEVILADDHSNDGTYEYLMGWCLKHNDKNITLLDRIPNVGANNNYLRGHQNAKGVYVAHLDGDDIVEQSKFTEQLKCFNRFPKATLVVHSSSYFVGLDSVTHLPGLLDQNTTYIEFSQADFARWGPISVHSSFMYKRASINFAEVSVPFMEWKIGMLVLNQGYGIFINRRLVRYRFNFGGPSWTGSQAGRDSAYKIQWQDLLCCFRQRIDLRRHLYAQAFTNLIGITRGASDIEFKLEIIKWLFKQCKYLNLKLIINAIYIRYKVRPKKITS